MTGNDIRRKYLQFFAARGHVIVPSSPLVPENDPTTLFTGSGMQPMIPYLMGEKHPKGTRVTDSQKSFRTDDIEEVGDNRHTTFFEMLGNWSFGDYFKKEQIEWMFDFLVNEIGIPPERLYISVFGGDEKNNLPRDEEAPKIWQDLFAQKDIKAAVADIGSEQAGYERGMKEGERIFYYEAKKNWWSRAGVPDKMPVGEPGGPDSEMFYDFSIAHDTKYGPHCHPNCDCGRFMEIGNNVFMQYVKRGEGKFEELAHRNIDFGGGLERIAAAAINNPDVFTTDLFTPVIEQIEMLSGKAYNENLAAFRIIADHIRGSVFMVGDGIFPSNTEQGYFLRRLLRRAVRYADVLGMPEHELAHLAESVIATYQDHYPMLADKKAEIIEVIRKEEARFRLTLGKGIQQLRKMAIRRLKDLDDQSYDPNEPTPAINSEQLFQMFTTFGFPFENSIEEIQAIQKESGWPLLEAERIQRLKLSFDKKMQEHQELSRAGAEQKFKGGLADHGEKTVQYHTATHLLLAALRKELGDHVHQAGSNITGERLRFDFTHPEKVNAEILARIETYVNDAIKAGATTSVEIMSKAQAHTDPSIEGSFWEKYPDEVKVYTVQGKDGTVFSRELCGGPHVTATEGMGTFKIVKEEASSAGVRRIKATLE